MSRYRGPAASVLLGAALAAVAFGAGGGTEPGRLVAVEICLIVVGGLAVASAVLWWNPERRRFGTATLASFAIITAVTVTSVLWSVSPDLSYLEGAQLLSYLGVFAAGVSAVRLAPKTSPVLLGGIIIGAGAVVAYSLAARVWPDSLGADELSNRISQPYGYWNAVGTTAALAIPPVLWLGSRRYGRPILNALAYPLCGLLIAGILLSQSRGALGAAVIGACLWLAFVPLRLRTLPVLLAGAAGAGGVGVWALSKDAFNRAVDSLSARESVAGEFGMLLLLMVVVLFGIGLAVHYGLERGAPTIRLRRRVGVAAVVVVCLIPLAGLTSVASSERGLSGTISHQANQLTSDTDSAPQGAGRLTSSSSARSRYWREAGKVFDQRPTLGTGAGTFPIASLRFRPDAKLARHAHGYLPQTVADLGLLGLAASALLLIAWLAAAGRTTGLLPAMPRRLRRRVERHVVMEPRRRRDWDSERVGLVALALVPITFGIQSTIDWTWYIPGCAVMALAAAAFVAARGPVGLAPGQPATAGGPVAATQPDPGPRRLPPIPSAGRMAVAVAVLLTATLAAWSVYQPKRSDDLVRDARTASAHSDFKTAYAKLDQAHDVNPLSPQPLMARGAIYHLQGRRHAAEKQLQVAVLRYPGNPETWLTLASYELGLGDRPQAALDAAKGALYLDPQSLQGGRVFITARQQFARLTAPRTVPADSPAGRRALRQVRRKARRKRAAPKTGRAAAPTSKAKPRQ